MENLLIVQYSFSLKFASFFAFSLAFLLFLLFFNITLLKEAIVMG